MDVTVVTQRAEEVSQREGRSEVCHYLICSSRLVKSFCLLASSASSAIASPA